MSFKSFFGAIWHALFYFAVYFLSQIIVVNWASIAISAYCAATVDHSRFLPEGISDISMLTADQLRVYNDALTKWLTDETLRIIDTLTMPLTLVSGILCLIAFVVLFRMRKKKLTVEAGITRLPLSQGITALALGFSANLFLSLFTSLLPIPEEWLASYSDAASFLNESSVLSWLTIVIAAPLVEEITFRGLFYTRLRRGMPMLAAMLLSAWVFGMIHGSILWVIIASCVGFLLVWIYEKMQSLTACILFHIAFNLSGQLGGLTGEISDALYWLLLTAGALASAALILRVQFTSAQKIELAMPQAPIENP